MAFAKFKVKTGLQEDTGYDTIPVGLIIPFSSSIAPDGWLLCDGSAISSTAYPNLYALMTSTPNLSASIVVGAGTGVGSGSSGIGQITGSSLTARTVNTLVAPGNTGVVDTTHSHSMAHTHTQPHTHGYPHYHSAYHNHSSGPGSHSHPGTDAQANHTHTGFYSNQYTTGTAQMLRGSGSLLGGGASATSGHAHVIDYGASSTGNDNSNSFASSAASTAFDASGTTSSDAISPASTVSPSLTGTPSSTFTVIQPSIAVYYIIKY